MDVAVWTEGQCYINSILLLLHIPIYVMEIDQIHQQTNDSFSLPKAEVTFTLIIIDLL